MRVMVLLKANEDSEKREPPPAELFAAVDQFNKDLTEARIMLTAGALQPTAVARRVMLDGPERAVIDGPFAEMRELVAGFWLWEVADMNEAVAWAKRCPTPMAGRGEIEIRPLYELSDMIALFGLDKGAGEALDAA